MALSKRPRCTASSSSGTFEVSSESATEVFSAVIAPYRHAYAVFNVARADLDAERNALHLVLRAFPAEAVVAEVDLCADACRLERVVKLGCLFGDAFFMLSNGNDYDLYRSDARRKNETVVVAVGHDYAADYAR